MPTTLSIQERIIRAIATLAAGCSGVVAVRIWDAREVAPFVSGEVVVSWGDAASTIIYPGNPGRMRVTLPVSLTYFLYEEDAAQDASDVSLVEWSEATKLRFLLNPYLRADGVRLAVSVLPASGKTPDFVPAGSPTATVLFDVTFDHDADSVYACGNAIAPVTE